MNQLPATLPLTPGFYFARLTGETAFRAIVCLHQCRPASASTEGTIYDLDRPGRGRDIAEVEVAEFSTRLTA